MNEKDLDIKYVILKIDDINRELNNIEKSFFWDLVEKIIARRGLTKFNARQNIRALINSSLLKNKDDLKLIDLETEMEKL